MFPEPPSSFPAPHMKNVISIKTKSPSRPSVVPCRHRRHGANKMRFRTHSCPCSRDDIVLRCGRAALVILWETSEKHGKTSCCYHKRLGLFFKCSPIRCLDSRTCNEKRLDDSQTNIAKLELSCWQSRYYSPDQCFPNPGSWTTTASPNSNLSRMY